MHIEVQWEMYDRAKERDFVGSINEMTVRTIAEAQKWVREQLPLRCHGDIEVDAVFLSEIGHFKDAGGCPCRTRQIGTYEPSSDAWTWA